MLFSVVENKAKNIELITLYIYSADKTDKVALKKNLLTIGSVHCHQGTPNTDSQKSIVFLCEQILDNLNYKGNQIRV